MGKKKAIKLATATAIAASAFVAVAPTQSEAATSSVDKAITKATNQMAKAYDTYHKAAKNEGKLPATGTIRNQVKLANEYYVAATKEIAKNGGSKTQKATYTKKLEAKKYFLDRAEAYLAAVNTNLNPAKTAFNEAVEGGKQKTVLAAQTAYNKAIKGFEAKVDKIYGPDARNLLKEKYAAPAHKLADSVNDEMKVYNAYKQIEGDKLIEKDLKKAGEVIESVKAEVAKLKAKDTKLAKNILAAVEKNDKAYEAALDAEVKSVSAINPKVVTLTGSQLQKLKVEDVTVDGHKVLSLSPAADGKTSTLTLETPLVEDQEYKVSVKTGEETKEFKVTYKFVFANVDVTTTTLEANKDKQFLQVTLNGVVTDLATLNSLGYDIEFQADKVVFTGASNVSTTGEIDETLAATQLNKTFNVKAVLKKDGKTAESKNVTVKVISAATPAIGNIELNTAELDLTKAVVSTKDTGVEVKQVVSNTGDVINVSGLSSFASSNPEVATINASTGAITPIKAGKTTITVTAGKVTYSKEITVVNETRVATKATANGVTVAPGATLKTNVEITDQFGEKLDVTDIIATGGSETIAVSEVTGEASVTAANATVDGKLPVTIAPAVTAKAGAYTVVIKDLTTLKNIGQFTVKVSADNVADNYKLEVADSSKGVANLAGTKTVALNAKEFTKSGSFLRTLASGDADATDFTVESANPNVATVDAVPNVDGDIVVTGAKVGSTQIILKKAGVQVATATITVKEEVPVIESIAWKNNGTTIANTGKTITYKDIFTITDAGAADAIVEGVKLSVVTTSKVRLDLTSTATPVLYLDKNDNGDLDSTEEVLGNVSAKLAGSAGETIVLASTQDWTTNILDAATVSKDKGTIVITVTDDDSNATVRASSTLNVDVK